ncbi:putative membrane protein SirB2 [Desulfohalotomaculum tongense]|uniref:hypothetical protein n=1 Tax=Desulforadius tongensis TaxID=1216062 RepID=UPI0019593AD4|nr:hypothetical protein [Desulforadius tongensis]MBM7855092.1 putative membrane protein SirB2 [Desulforadius tongensis]
MYLVITLAYLILGFIEIFPLYKNNQKKEAAFNTAVFLFSLIISLLLNSGIKIPSAARVIEQSLSLFIGGISGE